MKIIMALAVALSPSITKADECTSAGCISTIESLYTNSSGLIYISTPLDETKANCTAYAGNYFVLNPESPNAKEIYSSLLAAYMSDSKIQLRINEGSPNCELAYVRLNKNF